MIVLSDEPKALVLTASRMLEASDNLRSLFTIDELCFQLNDHIRELRSFQSDTITFMGTAGYYLFRIVEDGVEEIKVVLSFGDFYRYADDPATQQFVKQPGPMVYDESCPSEWLEEDNAN